MWIARKGKSSWSPAWKQTLTPDAFPNNSFEGLVAAIDPRDDAVNRTVAVSAVIPN